jgi:hypothetical protein
LKLKKLICKRKGECFQRKNKGKGLSVDLGGQNKERRLQLVVFYWLVVGMVLMERRKKRRKDFSRNPNLFS